MPSPKQVNPDLTDEQKAVLLHEGTEQPFSGKLLHNKAHGTYTCVNCGQPLFHSNTKFDSGSGWPSFYDVAKTGAVHLMPDSSHGMERTAVVCAKCHGHLGHVFADAPDKPTGQRYCISSVCLDFKPESKDGTAKT